MTWNQSRVRGVCRHDFSVVLFSCWCLLLKKGSEPKPFLTCLFTTVETSLSGEGDGGWRGEGRRPCYFQ